MAALADDPNKTWTIDELKVKGEKVYAANCVVCHQATGKGVPGAFAPLDGSAVVNGPKADADPRLAERAKERQVSGGNASLETIVRHRYRGSDHLHPQ